MKVLGIDPGTGRTGFALVENHPVLRIVDCGVISPPKGERWERFPIIYEEILRLAETHQPDLLAIEKLFFSKNIKTAMSVGEAIGVILLAAHQSKLPIREYTPLQIKEVLTGSGNAKKSEVKGMLELLLKQKIKGPDDVADAVAVAYCDLSMQALGI